MSLKPATGKLRINNIMIFNAGKMGKLELLTKSHYIYGCKVAYFTEDNQLLIELNEIHHELNKIIKYLKS